MKEAITKPLKGQEKAKAKGKTDARKAVSRREGVPPRAKVLSDGTTVVGIDIGERHVNLCEIDSDDAVTEARLANTPKKLREQFEGKAKRRIVLEAGAHTRWWCSPLKNRTRLSEIGQTHDGYEECDGRGHRACEAWAA